MSNEILQGKVCANPGLIAEPPLVEEKKGRGRKGRLLLFLMAIGLGTVALASISLLAPVTFYGHVGSTGGIADGSSRGDGATVPSVLAATSAAATDGIGTAIGDHGVTKSAEMTISGYSDSTYSTEMRCSIDLLPAYCSGSPVTFSGLPLGEHVFTVIGSVSGKTAVQSFSWDIMA